MDRASPTNAIMYDGECPVCSAYVRFIRLRETVGHVELIDLRDRPDLVSKFKAQGHDVNEGMVLSLDGREYFGAAAVNRMALLSSPSGIANKINRALLSNETVARLSYPILRSGRNAILWILGRRKI